MTCRECLERYSDFLDDRLEAGDRARYRGHLDRCPSCARYHKVVVNGLALVRTLPEVEPSTDFDERLRHRLYHLRDGVVLESSRADSSGMVAALVVAVLVSAAAWSPLLRPAPGTESEPPAAAVAEAAGGEWWYPAMQSPSFPDMRGSVPPILSMTFPGPYSPLIVEAPVEDGRAVAATHLHALE